MQVSQQLHRSTDLTQPVVFYLLSRPPHHPSITNNILPTPTMLSEASTSISTSTSSSLHLFGCLALLLHSMRLVYLRLLHTLTLV